MPGTASGRAKTTRQPLLYIRLYAALLGFVNYPNPHGALKPSLCRTTRFQDVQATIFFLIDGFRNHQAITAPPGLTERIDQNNNERDG
jgi:hypothetical protein